MTDPFDLGPSGAPQAPQYERSSGDPDRGPSVDSLAIGTPPVLWLVGALAAAVLGALLAAVALRSGWVTVVPWVVAGPLAIVLLGAFSITDTRRRAMPVYAAGSWVRPAYAAVVVVVLVAVVISALNIAFWAGHL